MKNETILGHVLTLMTIIIWGTTFVSTKVLLEAFTPIEILFFRFTLGYFSLWAIYPRKGACGTLRQEMFFAAAGLCGVTLYFLLENIALTYTFASNVGVIISIAPFFTALMANWLLDGEPLRKRFFIGFAAALTGIVLIGLNGNFVLKLNPVGDILATLAAVVWACYSILMKKIGAFRMNMVFCTRKVFFYGLLFMLPALFIFDCHIGPERFASPVNMLNLLYLGFGASALCFVTWNWAVRILGAVKTTVYIYLVPVVTVVSSVIILHETITPLAIAGTALTLTGLIVSQR